MPSAAISHKIVEQILEVLPTSAPGLSFQDVHARIGMWSLNTVKHGIRQLREEGLVIREGSHQHPEFRRIAV